MEDLLEANIACSICVASALMKSHNGLKEYKKKMAGETAKMTEFRAAMDGMMATTESAKVAYQKMSQDLADAKENIAILTKKLDNALNAQAITSTAFEKANEEKKALHEEASTRSSEVERLKGESSCRQSEISSLQANLEASAEVRSEAKGAYVNLLAEKKILEEKLASVEFEFTANFHNTEAYASFSAFFASVGQ
ncbi:hypothetical protein Fot_21427 [Forsythia ovata]|uniref:Uncharacterized protein n=1 Tax=Forsythia ovata TaxID=205694 RepID=A0ABD1UUT7_9LAMI